MTIRGFADRAGTAGASRVWTVQAVRELGAMVDVETTAAILGIGRTKAYEMAKAGEFPVRLVRDGRV